MDIETLGLLHHNPLPPVTCACLYDGRTDERVMLLFHGVTPEEHAANAATLLRRLDEAPVLAGYNAVYFDLVYVQRHFGATKEQLHAWVSKCVDPFMCLKHIVGRTCKLNVLLGLNGLGSKTGSGGNAIELAKRGLTQQLLDYCLMDAILTWELCSLPKIRLADHMYGWLKEGIWRLERYRLPPPPATPLPAIDISAVYMAFEAECC